MIYLFIWVYLPINILIKWLNLDNRINRFKKEKLKLIKY